MLAENENLQCASGKAGRRAHPKWVFLGLFLLLSQAIHLSLDLVRVE